MDQFRKLPNHVAFIMDGNRRWARAKKLPILIGHRKGFNRIEELVRHAKSVGISHLTFWAFSTENWNREQKEIEGLMGIFRTLFTTSSLKKVFREGARLIVFGDLGKFPGDIQEDTKKLIEDTKNNTNITVNIALGYGGRAEILRAVNQLLHEKKDFVDETDFSSHLYSAGQPDPDLVIRTGGEKRMSGYLPWQSVYSELYFTDTFWPDFDTIAFEKALQDFENRERRFGK